MSTKEPLTELIPSINYKKEMKRWSQFFNKMTEGKPNIGKTPRKAVWKKNKSTLWYYPAVEKKYSTPLFFVYSLFNKPYILDFAKGASVIEGLVNCGYDVYLLDWGSPGYEDKDISLSHYIVDYLQKSVRRALRHSSADEISIVGYCLGGTIASMYTAIAEEPIKNLILATVPIDFSVVAVPDKWAEGVKNGEFNADRFIDVYGVIPPNLVEGMFRAVSSPIYFSPYFTLLNRSYDERFVDKWSRMDKWTKDHVPFAGEAFRQLTNDLSRDNKLVKGELVIDEKIADLKNINANLLVISSKNDHLIPEEQSLPIMELVSSEDKKYLLVEAGHVSLALTGKFSTILDEWLKDRSKRA